MRYVYLALLVLIAWLLLDEFVLKDRSSEGLGTYRSKWTDLGRRLHFVVGVLAVLMLVFLLIRFIVWHFHHGW